MAGCLEAPNVVLIHIKPPFVGDGKKIYIPVMEVLLCAAAVGLEKYKKLYNWTSRSAVLLSLFLSRDGSHQRRNCGRVAIENILQEYQRSGDK